MRLISLAALLLVGQAWALAPSDRVENFRLIDQAGDSHELYYYSDARAVVVMIQGNGRKEYHVITDNGTRRQEWGYVWLWSSRGEEINNSQQFWQHYESPYAGNIYFTIPH